MSHKARPTYTAEFKAQAIELLALGSPSTKSPKGSAPAATKAAPSSMPTTSQMEIFAYIEACDNTRRKHSALAYRPPSQFELNLLSNN